MSLFVCDVVRIRILDGVVLRCEVCTYEEVVFALRVLHTGSRDCHESAMAMRSFTRLYFTRYVILDKH